MSSEESKGSVTRENRIYSVLPVHNIGRAQRETLNTMAARPGVVMPKAHPHNPPQDAPVRKRKRAPRVATYSHCAVQSVRISTSLTNPSRIRNNSGSHPCL